MMRRLHRWGFSRVKLRGGFLHSRLGDRLLERELWFPSRESLARAFAIGMPITTIPFLPAQSVIACAVAFMARANLPVAFALQYLSSPLTAAIQLPACYLAGRLLLGDNVIETFAQVRAQPMIVFTPGALGALYLGAAVIGPLLGAAGYFLVHALWREKPPRKPRTPQALAVVSAPVRER